MSASTGLETIAPSELAQMCKSGRTMELIDVRTPAEYQEIHVEFARNVPLDRLDPSEFLARNHTAEDRPLYVICRSGSRGRQACEKLLHAGVANVVNVEGGTMACLEGGLPMVRGKIVVSLERQVRVASGSLVLAGALLGWIVHPAFFGLCALIGAGLVSAGVTDTCGMGMLLARMPWNRAAGSSGCCDRP